MFGPFWQLRAVSKGKKWTWVFLSNFWGCFFQFFVGKKKSQNFTASALKSCIKIFSFWIFFWGAKISCHSSLNPECNNCFYEETGSHKHGMYSYNMLFWLKKGKDPLLTHPCGHHNSISQKTSFGRIWTSAKKWCWMSSKPLFLRRDISFYKLANDHSLDASLYSSHWVKML